MNGYDTWNRALGAEKLAGKIKIMLSRTHLGWNANRDESWALQVVHHHGDANLVIIFKVTPLDHRGWANGQAVATASEGLRKA